MAGGIPAIKGNWLQGRLRKAHCCCPSSVYVSAGRKLRRGAWEESLHGHTAGCSPAVAAILLNQENYADGPENGELIQELPAGHSGFHCLSG